VKTVRISIGIFDYSIMWHWYS